MNRKGVIDMGAQRCAGNTEAGGICKLRTRYGCLCWVHRAKLFGVAVRKSQIIDGGMGLFATHRIPPHTAIVRYSGEILDTAMGARRRDAFGGSAYVLEITGNYAIDAARTDTADGRLVDDARGSRFTANAELVCDRGSRSACVKSGRRAINAGDEIFASYGAAYWSQAAAAKRVKAVTDANAAAPPAAAVPAAAAAAAAPRGMRGRKSALGSASNPIEIDAITVPAIRLGGIRMDKRLPLPQPDEGEEEVEEEAEGGADNSGFPNPFWDQQGEAIQMRDDNEAERDLDEERRDEQAARADMAQAESDRERAAQGAVDADMRASPPPPAASSPTTSIVQQLMRSGDLSAINAIDTERYPA